MAASVFSEDQLLRKIASFSLLSRVVLIILQIVFNAIVPDHDAGVFNPPTDVAVTVGYLDHLVQSLLGGFRRWDAVYFTHVSENGYTYENSLAFFPLYPVLVRVISNSILYPLQFILNYNNVILISSVTFNIYLFVQTAINIYRLGKQILNNDVIAYKAALLFCVNPASIFMTAPYSETLFIYLSVLGMLKVESNSKLMASIYFGLSCATRSNGLLNLGYLGYKMVKNFLKQRTFKFVFTYIIPYTILILLGLLPFAAYQLYCYKLYCTGACEIDIPEYLREYGLTQEIKICGDAPSSWCNSTVPLAYSYIQKHYWNQGLFNYWELKQIPNFLLATPVTILTVGLVHSFFRHNKYTCLTLGLDDVGYMKKTVISNTQYHLQGPILLPYILHVAALTIVGWFFIHIQVLTRLLFSSCPVLYWYAACLVTMDTPPQQPINKLDVMSPRQPVESSQNLQHLYHNLLTNQIMQFKKQDNCTKLILLYFLSYYVIGTLMFCNFLPWT